MRKALLLGDEQLEGLDAAATASIAHASEVKVLLKGRFRPEVAEFFADAPGKVRDCIAEIRRLRSELQHLLRLSVKEVDASGRAREGDVGEAGMKRRGKRRTDADDGGKQRRK